MTWVQEYLKAVVSTLGTEYYPCHMRALVFDGPGLTPYITDLPIPDPKPTSAIIKVEATGLCRSDWHAWMGHDDDITHFPHTPGHEFAGTIAAVGTEITQLKVGDRVTVPFVSGCGTCIQCQTNNAQVCPNQWQPGFDGPGSFANFVAIPNADFNVVKIPDSMSYAVAASLGCRFATSYRGLVLVHQTQATDTVAIFGCGGIGLAAIMIAKSRGATVIAVDLSDNALAFALSIGADHVINASHVNPVLAIRELTGHGASVSVDALGSVATSSQCIQSLRPRGHHLQIGLLPPVVIKDRATVAMHTVISRELNIHGVHGMSAADYPKMLADISSGLLHPEKLIATTITLEEAPEALMAMDQDRAPGITVIAL